MSFENLYSFLCSLQLELYHEIFINAGVTDHDWHQFVQFTDEELEEFVSAVNMLPFHAIKFKKAIRKLHMPPETQSETSAEVPNDDNPIFVTSTQEFIKANAIIYGKNKKRKLTAYEEAINNASLEIALENPLLLISKKGQLFTLAKKKLLEGGYEYKRGSSRSKLKEINTQPPKKKSRESLLQKRQEIAQKASEKPMSEEVIPDLYCLQ